LRGPPPALAVETVMGPRPGLCFPSGGTGRFRCAPERRPLAALGLATHRLEHLICSTPRRYAQNLSQTGSTLKGSASVGETPIQTSGGNVDDKENGRCQILNHVS